MKSETYWNNVVAWASVGGCIAGLAVAEAGCGKKESLEVRASTAPELGKGLTAQERPYYEAGKPFAAAIAAHDYQKAYEYLSSHARARMSPSQFVAPDDEATEKRNEAATVQNPAAEQFAQMLVPTEKQYGKPIKLLDAQVFSIDPVALSGKGKSVENKLDSMFAIGMMPESIPTDIRKASLRCKLGVELSPAQLAEAAKAEQTTPEKLKNDPEFKPYLNLKIVLVQEGGALKVGYFEFIPPGILD